MRLYIAICGCVGISEGVGSLSNIKSWPAEAEGAVKNSRARLLRMIVVSIVVVGCCAWCMECGQVCAHGLDILGGAR